MAEAGRTSWGVTELGRMMGSDPHLALSVLDSLGRWEAGRSAGGMDPQRKGWVRVQDRARETGSSSRSMQQQLQHQQRGEDTPPKSPKKKHRFESREEDTPPRSRAEQAQGQAQAQAQGQGQGQGQPPPQTPSPPLAR